MTEILTCRCHSVEHQIVISCDEEWNEVYCHIHLTNRGFFERLISGIKYIFGYKCKYGHWDEFIFNPGDVDKLERIIKMLKNGNDN